MSSTNRGQKGGGDAEFFPTPPWPTHRIIDRLPLPGGDWLEPSAGDGSIIRAVNELRGDVSWTAVEMREECRDDLLATGAEVHIAAFQRWAVGAIMRTKLTGRRPFTVAPLNPPFSLALIFVELCLSLADHVVCLQRTPWILDAADRYEAFHNNMPDDYRIGRVDFDGRGGDSVPYSWFHWGPDTRGRDAGRLFPLPVTAPAERKHNPKLPPPRQGKLF